MQIYLPIAEMSVNIFLLIGLGGMVGILSGMFGVGGGFLMTPLLFFIGIPPAVAVATEANQIVASSFSGVLAHVKKRTVDFKMGTVLLMGGLLGAAVGVQVFKYLKEIGQVDLLITLSYVVFLGMIGGLMFIESLGAIRRSKNPAPPKKVKRHTWIHGLPLKMRFRTSNLYISAIPPFVVGALAMIGVPPTCGFFSKWYLITGGMLAERWEYMAALMFSTMVMVVLFFRLIERIHLAVTESGENIGHGHGDLALPESETFFDEGPLSMLIP
ncbi:MAG: TSUP family transporter, partial [Paracoccaceae bacterium]